MKKTPLEKTYNCVKENAKELAWALDITFANLMYPILKEYITVAKEKYCFKDLNLTLFNKLQILFYTFFDKNRVEEIKQLSHDRQIAMLEDILATLEDMRTEDAPEWKTRWLIDNVTQEVYNKRYQRIMCWRKKNLHRFIDMIDTLGC